MSRFDTALGLLHQKADAFFAKDALLKASGEEYPCQVELFLPEPEFGLDDVKTVAPDTLLRVNKAGIPEPKTNDVFEIIGADSYRVIAKPTTEDDDGLRWTVKVLKV